MSGSRYDSLKFTHVAGIAFTVALGLSGPAVAQSTDSVIINMDALNELDPKVTQPRLLMPSARPSSGRIVLTPPQGVDPITPQRSRIVLRPPPGAPARIRSAPTVAVAPPAAAATAPPTSVTAPPPAAAEPEPSPAPGPSSSDMADAASPPTTPAPETAATPEAAAPPVAPPASTPEVPAASDSSPDTLQDPAPEPETQTAALPPASEEIESVSVSFAAQDTSLSQGGEAALQPIIERMSADEDVRVRLMAYAASNDDSPSSVRRLSLNRAIAVREFLMNQGVQSTRIEVRALGDQSEDGDPDRVDAILNYR